MGVSQFISAVASRAANSITNYLGVPSTATPSAYYIQRDLKNNAFMYTIHSTRYKSDFKGKLPEKFNLDIQSQFNNMLEDNALSSIGGKIGQALKLTSQVTGAAGMNFTKSKYSTAYRWTGSSPIVFTLPYELIAIDDVQEDVWKPFTTLNRMVLPAYASKSDVLLAAPGPLPIDTAVTRNLNRVGGDNITVRLGTFMKLEKAIIRSVTSDINTQRLHNSTGYPMSITGTITVQASSALVGEDIVNMFKPSNTSSNRAQIG